MARQTLPLRLGIRAIQAGHLASLARPINLMSEEGECKICVTDIGAEDNSRYSQKAGSDYLFGGDILPNQVSQLSSSESDESSCTETAEPCTNEALLEEVLPIIHARHVPECLNSSLAQLRLQSRPRWRVCSLRTAHLAMYTNSI